MLCQAFLGLHTITEQVCANSFLGLDDCHIKRTVSWHFTEDLVVLWLLLYRLHLEEEKEQRREQESDLAKLISHPHTHPSR